MKRTTSMENVVYSVLEESIQEDSLDDLLQAMLEAETPDEFLPLALQIYSLKKKFEE